MRYYYARYRPYGDKMQANRLERYNTRRERDAIVSRDPLRDAVAGHHRAVRYANRHPDWWIENDYPFMD